MTTLAEIKARHEIGIIDTDKLWLIAEVKRLKAKEAELALLCKCVRAAGMEAAAKILDEHSYCTDQYKLAAAIRAEIKTC